MSTQTRWTRGAARAAMRALAASAGVAWGLHAVGCNGKAGEGESAAEVMPPLTTEADMDALTGPAWKGTLTYLDYTSEKTTTIASTLVVVRRPASGAASWDVRIGYTDEPEKDGGETVTMSRGRDEFLGARIVERARLEGGTLRITTEARGEDDRRPALIRKIHTLGPTRYVLRKMVRFDGTAEFFERHRYDWSR